MGQIQNDHSRFKKIVRRKVKRNLHKFISQGQMTGKQGKRYISIPLPSIDIPHFRFGKEGKEGAAQGEGEVGDPLSQPDQEGEGREGGTEPGRHLREVEISMEELAEIIGEELELPNIEHKGKGNIISEEKKYTTIHQVGPDSLRHHKRTYKEAIKRQLRMGQYNPKKPKIVPIPRDYRFRSWKPIPKPETNVVVFYMMDVSGSMGQEEKELVRLTSFWIETWLKYQYKGVKIRYIIHDVNAQEVDRDTFFTTTVSGGTAMAKTYELCYNTILRNHNPRDWNVYVFHFTDGDNWGTDDDEPAIETINKMMPQINMLGYGQVKNRFWGGEGRFSQVLTDNVDDIENLVISHLDGRESVMDTIRDFFKKGL